MISYPFISELFTSILSKSKAIEGRFFMCPKMGREISTNDLDQVLKDLVIPDPAAKKYPLVLMMPPTIIGHYRWGKGEWEEWRVTLFFLKRTYNDGDNQTSSPNPNTRTSTHTVMEDWHDMKRCAENFLRVLDRVQRTTGLINCKFQYEPQTPKQIYETTMMGSDRVSGVQMNFNCSVFNGCDLEDYNQEDIDSITIPVSDSHPEHKI